MSGLYIHIPFCKRICAYCDFFKCADLRSMPAVTEAMHLELEEENRFIGDRQLQSIYFGGGTPSLLEPDELQRFIDRAARLFDISRLKEITVEVNPDDINAEYITALRRTAVNRISIGIQSFDERLLRLMNRRHTGLQAEEAVRAIQEAGYGNVTADLIFGIDGFADERLESDIERLLGLGVQHISAYALTYEEGTALYTLRQNGSVKECDDELSLAMYETLIDRLQAAGFEQYEISNFALPGYHSRHNSSYWQNIPYLGLGAAAHSYDGLCRRYNPQDTMLYIKSMEAHRCCYAEEHLSTDDRFNDMLLTRLRTRRGINCDTVRTSFGDKLSRYLLRQATPYLRQGCMEYDAPYLRIARRGIFISDSIIADLFHIDEKA